MTPLGNFIGYHSAAFGLPLLVHPGIAKVLDTADHLFQLHFPLPFVQKYSGHLFCVNPKTFHPSAFRIPHNVLPEVDNYVPLDFAVTDFDTN
jgi:hypothetical protein